MVTGYGICVNNVVEQRAISCIGFWRRTGTKPHGDRKENVRKSNLKEKTGRERCPRRKLLTHRKVAARSWCGRRGITALYPYDNKGTARAPYGNLATVAPEPYDYPKNLQSSYDFFFPKNYLKFCVVRTISARPLYGVRAGIVR